MRAEQSGPDYALIPMLRRWLTGPTSACVRCVCLQRRLYTVRCAHLEPGDMHKDALHTAAGVTHGVPRVLVLTGPTAVGKTQLSLALAEQLDGEVVSADSVQVYKGLNIGSDKARLLFFKFCQTWYQADCNRCLVQITDSERRGVPHHLLDILPADAEFSAGHFYDLARAAIQDIVQVSLFSQLTLSVSSLMRRRQDVTASSSSLQCPYSGLTAGLSRLKAALCRHTERQVSNSGGRHRLVLALAGARPFPDSKI